MGARKSFDLDLGPQEALLDRQLESGRYQDVSDVMRDALRALQQRDAAFDQALREDVQTALADRRTSIPAEDVFARIETRFARHVDTTQHGA